MGLLATAFKTVADWVRAGYPEEVAKRIVSGELPMDEASRMARATEQGYDTSRPVYHGTDTDFLEFDPDRAIGSQFWSTTDKAAVERGDVGAAGHGVIKELYHNIQNPAGWEEYDKLLLDEITGRGYDGLRLSDPDGHATMVAFDPKQYKSTDAAFDPKYTGSNIMGGLALPVTAGLLAAGQSEDADAGFVTRGGKTLLEAWHGSPHKFDRFSMDAIGTGEGAQAYGHGLYFADSEDVARQYRDELSQTLRPKTWIPRLAKDNNIKLESHAIDDFTLYGNAPNLSVEEAADAIIGSVSDRQFGKNDFVGERSGLINAIKQLREETLYGQPMGHLYRTEIDVTPESLLDWDKPLSEQSEAVRGAIESLDPTTRGMRQYAGEERTGRDFYWGLQAPFKSRSEAESFGISKEDYWLSDDERASKMLREAGIPGIKYLDGDSRAVGDGTSNYVIFDDSLINIAERGNATVPMLGATAGLSGGGLLAASLTAPQVKDSGMISAPRSEGLFNLTMGARDLERRLEGSPASLLFPSGLVEYLETVNRREEDPNAMTRGMALLDVLPW
jgi:hypothetical protein